MIALTHAHSAWEYFDAHETSAFTHLHVLYTWSSVRVAPTYMHLHIVLCDGLYMCKRANDYGQR